MAGIIRKSMVMTAILAIALTGFVGFLSAEEPAVDDPVFTVTDTYAPFDDRNAYVGDTFNFTVAPYAAPLNNSNVSLEITIGVVTYDMIWNVDIDMWVYEFTPVIGDVGKHVVTINATATNTTGIWNATATDITVWEPVAFVSTAVLPTFTEDTTTSWVISNFFTPLIDMSEEPLAFAAVGGFPTGWTFTPTVVENVTTWAVTPPANFFGSVDINVTATDANDVMVYHVFTLAVGAVNDGPVIEGIMVGADLLTVETWNAGDTTNYDNKTAINLSMSEDTPLEMMVHAVDVDNTDVTYTLSEMAVYTVAETVYQNATGVNYTVPSNLTITPAENVNGEYYAYMNVSDGTLTASVMVHLIIAAVNDAPTATEAWDASYARKTGEVINLTLADVADIDEDNVTMTWYIDGTAVADSNHLWFAHTWTAAGTYNVSVKISDGTATVDVGYFLVTVTIANRAPTITSTTASKAEITEGDPVTLKVVATDLDGDTLTYLWKNDKDTSFTSNKSEVEVKDLKEGTYKFTVTVSDGTVTATGNVTVTVKPAEDDGGITTIIIIVIAIIAILAILIILFFVLRGGKEEEETLTAPAEGEVPAPEEQPVGEEAPAEESSEVPVEEPIAAETPEQVTEEEVPVPPQAPPQ